MIISSVRNSSVYNNENPKQNVAFGATVPQIKAAIASAELCPGKRKYFEGLVSTCARIQKGLKNAIEIKLDQPNKLPKGIKKEVANEFRQLDTQFQTDAFSCGTKAECTCGKNKTLGEFVKDYFAEKLHLNKPSVIELKQKNS